VETVGIWLLIFLVLAVGFGPVYWLVDTEPAPSARVSAGGVLKSPTIECVAYRLPDWQAIRSAGADALTAPTWRIQRSGLELPGPAPGWRWESAEAGLSDPALRGAADYWLRVLPLIDRLPDDAVAAEAGPLAVSCYWREAGSADTALARVDDLAQVLSELLDIQRKFRDQRRAGRGG
jgi:hypothetical protein